MAFITFKRNDTIWLTVLHKLAYVVRVDTDLIEFITYDNHPHGTTGLIDKTGHVVKINNSSSIWAE